MADFENIQWQNVSNLNSKQFICWNCGNEVASNWGYTFNINGFYRPGIYICPHCNAPHIVDVEKSVFPGIRPGKPIKKLPEHICRVYEEARSCIFAGADTAAVMMLRKILMNLAVEDGAAEGLGFGAYVTYLCENGLIHKRQHLQAERIKRLGNDANHKIESRTQAEAMELLTLVALILVNNYEQADPMPEPQVVLQCN